MRSRSESFENNTSILTVSIEEEKPYFPFTNEMVMPQIGPTGMYGNFHREIISRNATINEENAEHKILEVSQRRTNDEDKFINFNRNKIPNGRIMTVIENSTNLVFRSIPWNDIKIDKTAAFTIESYEKSEIISCENCIKVME